MKRFIFFLLLPGMMAACNGPSAGNEEAARTDSSHVTDDIMPPTDTMSLAGEWYLQPVLPSDTGVVKTPALHFDLAVKRVSGNTGCNSFSGSFESTDSTITFNRNMVMTKMACPGYNENNFIENLLRTTNYSFDNGLLVLKFGETELSRWARKPPEKPEVNKV